MKKQKIASRPLSKIRYALIPAMVLLMGFGLIPKTQPGEPELAGEIQTALSDMVPEVQAKALKAIQDPASFRIPMLIYHYVENVANPKDKKRQKLNTTPAVFEKQLTTLIDSGYTFVSLSQVAQVLDSGVPLPPKSVILTFDDGYRDFYTNVFPLLKKYKVHATAYLVPGFFGQSNYMTLDQVREIAQSGLVEIGAHTMHHIALAGIPNSKALKEIVDSKTFLERNLGIAVTTFAYPYGSFNLNTEKIVKGAGFLTAVSTVFGQHVSQYTRYFLFRIHPGNRVSKFLLHYIR
jgi:peptidoglycan/xylan/chitin deacetylase (PgdA/CDA1 family)